jgi:hypothetical protein
VDHQVHVPLQDGVHRPPVSLLNVHLPLVAPRLRAQLRVPGVPQVRIRDVGYTNYVEILFRLLKPGLILAGSICDSRPNASTVER